MRIGKIAEGHGARGTGLDTSRRILPFPQRTVLRAGFVAGVLQAVMTEGALLDDALGPDGHVGIQMLLHGLGPDRLTPVEISRRVRTRRRAVAATDTPAEHLADDPLLVQHRRPDGAHLHTGRIVTMEAGPGQQTLDRFGPLTLPREGDHLHPREVPALAGIVRAGRGKVVLRLTSGDTRLAGRAAVQVDCHAPLGHRLLLSTLARLRLPYRCPS